MEATPTVGLGCMRLSTDPVRDETRAMAVVHAALDAGVTLLDTADAYCHDESEVGHNEQLIARALATWTGDRSRIVVATKGGLTRPSGRWVPDGRASYLRAACESSRRALGVERIQLYQLHAVDPRTPLATSVRALAALKRDGLIDQIGLCNVTVGQIEEAQRVAEIASVQVALSIWNDDAVLGGVVEYCLTHGLRLIAHTPLGGPKRARRTASEPLIAELAARYQATPAEVALAWLMNLSDLVVPIAGATRVDTARSLARAHALRFTDEERGRLDARFTASRRPREAVNAETSQAGEVVAIMGLPAAGKTTVAQTLVEQGYVRLNRDEDGGSLRALLPAFARLVESGATRIVLDNTYISRKSRAALVQAAAGARLPVRCVWLSTSVEEAQVNACQRMLATYGHLLEPDEIKRTVKHDVNAFGPSVQFRYQRELEPPQPDEGFSRIEIVPFARQRETSFTNRAVLIWCDGVLCRSRSNRRAPLSPADVEVIAGRSEPLRRLAADGWALLGLSWRPEIAEDGAAAEEVDAAFARMRELLEVDIDVRYCPHGGGPPACWCRKPLPGLAVSFIQQYRLDPAQCLYVGAGAQDPGFARRIGFDYRDAAEFFEHAAHSA